MNLFVCVSTEENASLFLGPGSGIRICLGVQRVTVPGDHSQLVVRGKERDRKSGAEVEEGLDGERNLLVVVEWDVLHTFHVSQFSARKAKVPIGDTDLVFTVHSTGLNEHVRTR